MALWSNGAQEKGKTIMKEILEKLKADSIGRFKLYAEPVNVKHAAFIGDLLCSFVIETGIVKQGILTLSHKDKGDFTISKELNEAIEDVFELPYVLFVAQYPIRGHCIQYAFRLQQN